MFFLANRFYEEDEEEDEEEDDFLDLAKFSHLVHNFVQPYRTFTLA